ncbi:UDP-glucuronosyltransferase 2B1-like [Synchiropus splendidus]|uniref:UDP-glucuronosyltransferase 2B1-like n=1 Tax=Synchiropus splendidus TaxID=270530 RepID=UPI00237E2DAC|nr:UDP-glucuronosyltransferase 2B1-like [Synchiropus splendidus]XP_053720666.1 UDP-glucuronosyltransferase 2B1-like [Synchiropus splendidus]XP_053720667.1 UDP-glucuronosyltransferase 2B1-like [Synchiropus splendidus]
MYRVWISIFLLCAAVTEGGKVLVYPVDGSHWVNMKVLIEELHSRGHQVAVFRPRDSWYIKEKSRFYTSIPLDHDSGFDEEFVSRFAFKLLKIQQDGLSFWVHYELMMEAIKNFAKLHEKSSNLLEALLENKNLVKSLKEENYDLVLTDPGVPAGAILSHYLKIPLVFNVRWAGKGDGHFVLAPSPLSYIPMTGTEFSDKMSFLERVVNMLVYFLGEYQFAKHFAPYYSDIINKYLGTEMDYNSILQAADLWLMRVDFVFEFPRPTMPNIIYIGGFQCKPAKPLPEDLEEFVQSSGEHGVIVMSLGTIIGALPGDVANNIAAAFARLPQKVIWRHTGDRPTTLGNNTLLVDWMPQKDLLGHPKVKLFVPHGGTNGVQEAIYHGVPILGMPLIFDQRDNVLRIVARGAGKIIRFSDLTEETFYKDLQEVLTNPSYRSNMQRLSRLHRDQPKTPMDTAIFWLEFVMRHKGAAHLRSESFKLSWYQYHCVDVMLVLATAVILTVGLVASFIRCLCARVCHRTKRKHD